MKYIRRKIRNIKSHINYRWGWLGVLSSPFVGLKLGWHFGDVEHGVPWKLPSNNWFKIDFVSLGWKTKYDDFRNEWNPMFSLVLFKKQLVAWVLPNTDCSSMHYWESWLDYKHRTNKNNSEKERVKELVTKYPQTWGWGEKVVNYHYNVLKPKYKYLIDETKTNDTY